MPALSATLDVKGPNTLPTCKFKFLLAYLQALNPSQSWATGITRAACPDRIWNIVVNGSIVNASLVISGVADVYLRGLHNLAKVNLAGTANLFIEPASGVHAP